jgi:hypothetical protein
LPEDLFRAVQRASELPLPNHATVSLQFVLELKFPDRSLGPLELNISVPPQLVGHSPTPSVRRIPIQVLLAPQPLELPPQVGRAPASIAKRFALSPLS